MIDQRDIELCQNITKQIADFQKYIDGKVSDGQAIILFFGSTWVGKSTLATLLTGKTVTVERYGPQSVD